ncbi:hypothetical protein NMG60_11002807 [Bertholletia excelsa]
MEVEKVKEKKNLFIKTWNRCRSLREKSSPSPPPTLSRSKSSQNRNTKSSKVAAPQGCFPVYVGPERQRFVIKAKQASHPLFRMLLEDSEMEYGYSSQGPLLLPNCEVGLFYKVLAEMDAKEIRPSYGLVYGSCSPFSPIRRRGKMGTGEGCGSYGLLVQSPLLRVNGF